MSIAAGWGGSPFPSMLTVPAGLRRLGPCVNRPHGLCGPNQALHNSSGGGRAIAASEAELVHSMSHAVIGQLRKGQAFSPILWRVCTSVREERAYPLRLWLLPGLAQGPASATAPAQTKCSVLKALARTRSLEPACLCQDPTPPAVTPALPSSPMCWVGAACCTVWSCRPTPPIPKALLDSEIPDPSWAAKCERVI